jgi:hypothetical protein
MSDQPRSWQALEPRQLDPNEPLIFSNDIPSGPGPLLARILPSEVGDIESSGVELDGDLVFRVTGEMP